MQESNRHSGSLCDELDIAWHERTPRIDRRSLDNGNRLKNQTFLGIARLSDKHRINVHAA
jgi:hypothetical protein